MRIGIEAQRIFRKKKHGMDIVALELITNLQRIDKENEYFIFVKNDVDQDVIKETDNFKIVKLRRSIYPIWEQVLLPRAAKKYKLDLLHCTANTAPLFCRIPIALTLHDVIFLEKINMMRGSLYQRFGNLYRRLIVPRIVKKCAIISTVSDSENEIATKKLRLPEGSIKTIHNGVGHHFRPAPEPEIVKLRNKYQLSDRFIFALGNKDPRKNTKLILRAFINVARAVEGVDLFMSDIDPAYISDVIRKSHGDDVLHRIKCSGYIHNRDLPAIYSAAEVFVFPSTRESFGIPVLEAMACNTYVVTSNSSSMPEVAGNAALLVDPGSEESVSEGILKILKESQNLNGLKAKGGERAKRFTWENTARKWLDLYTSTVDQPFKF